MLLQIDAAASNSSGVPTWGGGSWKLPWLKIEASKEVDGSGWKLLRFRGSVKHCCLCEARECMPVCVFLTLNRTFRFQPVNRISTYLPVCWHEDRATPPGSHISRLDN